MQLLSAGLSRRLGGEEPFRNFHYYLRPLRAGRGISLRGLKSTVWEADMWKKDSPRLYSLCERSYSKNQYCKLMDNLVDSDASLTEVLPDLRYKEILVSKHGGLLTITLNRPLEHNAINYQMYSEWQQALTEAGDDSDVVVAMITGAGDYYCSGNDLSNFMNVKQAVDIATIQRKFVSAFIQFPKPLLAAINGPAIGISVTVLGFCDLVYASDKATFHTPFKTLGQSSEGCSSIAKTYEVNKRLTAQEAYKKDLVTDIFPDNMFRKKVHKIASNMAKQDLPEWSKKSERLRQKQIYNYLKKNKFMAYKLKEDL